MHFALKFSSVSGQATAAEHAVGAHATSEVFGTEQGNLFGSADLSANLGIEGR